MYSLSLILPAIHLSRNFSVYNCLYLLLVWTWLKQSCTEKGGQPFDIQLCWREAGFSMMSYSRNRYEEGSWPQQTRKQRPRAESMRASVWEVDKKDENNKWDKSWQQQADWEVTGKCSSRAEIIWVGGGKKQTGINSHRTQMEGKVKVCLITWKKALSGKHDTAYGPNNGAFVGALNTAKQAHFKKTSCCVFLESFL